MRRGEADAQAKPSFGNNALYTTGQRRGGSGRDARLRGRRRMGGVFRSRRSATITGRAGRSHCFLLNEFSNVLINDDIAKLI